MKVFRELFGRIEIGFRVVVYLHIQKMWFSTVRFLRAKSYVCTFAFSHGVLILISMDALGIRTHW